MWFERISADSLPVVTLNIKFSLLISRKVGARDNADKVAAFHHRQVPVSAVFHHSEPLDRQVIKPDRVRSGRHHLGQDGRCRIQPHRDNTADDILLRHNAFQLALGDQGRRMKRAGGI